MSQLPPDTRLWVAGEGQETDELMAEHAGDSRIEWLGTISETEKIARLRGADVFCAPSLGGESFGIVLLEAMAAGTAVVAGDIPGYANVARQGRDALLVPPNDARALADALTAVLSLADERERLVESGLKRSEEFSMARLAQLYLGRYERLPPVLLADSRQVRPGARDQRYIEGLRGGCCAREESMVITLIVLGIVVVLVFYVISLYNNLVKLRNRIENAWAQIDVQLKRRWDLIPNLVETVKGYASHEKETLESVIAARNAATTATGPQQSAGAENMLTGALRQLFAVSEAYPDLKANQNFLELQEELTGTEGRIAYARQHYNDQVLKYNTAIETFPAVILAGPLRFTEREYFEADDESRGNVQVEF